MPIRKPIGGNRLGSGNKMNVDLHGYERSTHDLSYVWRSSMSSGTLVPFMNLVALPGDTFDIDLDVLVNTHPTVGPLFGSYKVQLDVFTIPVRLYVAQLHNNMLGVGNTMSNVKLPVMGLSCFPSSLSAPSIDTHQINPSCLLSYLGIKGVGFNPSSNSQSRQFNAVPMLGYWDIYKNYYANKQEEIGVFINTPINAPAQVVTSITFQNTGGTATTIPFGGAASANFTPQPACAMRVAFSGTTPPDTKDIILETNRGPMPLYGLSVNGWTLSTGGVSPLNGTYNPYPTPGLVIFRWNYKTQLGVVAGTPVLETFPLSNIDRQREAILRVINYATPLDIILTPGVQPYLSFNQRNTAQNVHNRRASQQGLGIKTYQSDLFNNWIQTTWIDTINFNTRVDTSSGSFTIDVLNISKKVYDILNRVAISGGSYDDWIEAVYAHEKYRVCETPLFVGGMTKELVFEEVVSNASGETAEGEKQELGTLAGKGRLASGQKGGSIVVKVDEPSYIMGIASLTPRVDYSQGNDWHTTEIMTMDDFHKPGLDGIGFQELITEQMAWWDTHWNSTSNSWVQRSAGKQPAWINYMTSVNKCYGNFATLEEENSETFMTLNRRYEQNPSGKNIKDLTTYIDPSKFNFIFAANSLDMQNFWMQIGCNITARRKMSAKVMPNL